MTPALLTRPSSPPIASLAPSTRAFAWLSSEMSASIATALPPSPSIFATSSSRRGVRGAGHGRLAAAVLAAGAVDAAAAVAADGGRAQDTDPRPPAGDEDLYAIEGGHVGNL